MTAVELPGRRIPALETPDGLHALVKDAPGSPESVERYFRSKFGDEPDEVRTAMETLAQSRAPRDLAATGFKFHEAFRHEVTSNVRGWGANGVLDNGRILALVRAAH